MHIYCHNYFIALKKVLHFSEWIITISPDFSTSSALTCGCVIFVVGAVLCIVGRLAAPWPLSTRCQWHTPLHPQQ